MCSISNKIKFCFCKVTSAEKLENYWVLHRYNKDKNEIFVGEIFLSYPIDLNFKANHVILEKRLNETSAFDVPIIFKAKDQLEVVFNSSDYYKREIYGFKFLKGKWTTHKTDTFNLMSHFDEIQFGKIKK